MSYVISNHAREQLALRGISEDMVTQIMDTPDQVIELDDKKVYQSVISEGGRQYLIRIFVNYFKDPNVIITAYKTSKISKYYESNIR